VRLAMIGTRGVPARYGGFETAVEEIGWRLADAGHEVIVYCRNPDQELTSYRGMTLVNLPALRRRSLETLSHSGLSAGHAIVRSRPDVAFVFNAANAPFLPLLRAARIPVAVHVDGLEWKRAKWEGAGAAYYRRAERWSVRWADAVIADAHGIADHVRQEYGRESVYIPYGAPIVHPGSGRLPELGLEPHGFHLVVARFEPENHVLEIVHGYVASDASLPLIVVGSAPYADEYTRRIHAAARSDPRVRFLGAVWDQDQLDELYGNCLSYLHGHSVGGTNPSLLRAMGAGAPVIAHDNVFNREVTGGHAVFFRGVEEIVAAVLADETDPRRSMDRGEAARSRATTSFCWDEVAARYGDLAVSLDARRNRLVDRRLP